MLTTINSSSLPTSLL